MLEPALLEVRGVSRRFAGAGGGMLAVDEVSLSLRAGETLGIVGESGSGKSTLGRLVAGLDTPTAGAVLLDGAPRDALAQGRRSHAARRVQMVFQDPYASLNPRMTVGRQVAEPLVVAGDLGPRAIAERVAALFESVGLRRAQMGAFPHEFSGGQRQRLAIARALAPGPSLVVADEPVSALDVSVQAQILNLLMDLQREAGLAYLFITHDIGVVAHVSHAIAVMFRGRIVEQGLAHEIIGDARHAYTRALLDAVPRFGRRRGAQSTPTPISRPLHTASRGELRIVSDTHRYWDAAPV